MAKESPEMWMKLMKLMMDGRPFPEVGVSIEDGRTIDTSLDKPITGESGVPLKVFFFSAHGVHRLNGAPTKPINPPLTYEVRNVF